MCCAPPEMIEGGRSQWLSRSFPIFSCAICNVEISVVGVESAPFENSPSPAVVVGFVGSPQRLATKSYLSYRHHHQPEGSASVPGSRLGGEESADRTLVEPGIGCAPRTSRPGVSPVDSPSVATSTPLTNVCR